MRYVVILIKLSCMYVCMYVMNTAVIIDILRITSLDRVQFKAFQ